MEIDIGNCPSMAMENMGDGIGQRTIEIPKQSALVQRQNHPQRFHSMVRQPLDVGDFPQGDMVEPARGGERVVQVDDEEAAATGEDGVAPVGVERHGANGTIDPETERVAEGGQGRWHG